MNRRRCVVGVDGGGSGVRVAVVTPDLAVIGEGRGRSANPSSVGRPLAAQRIRQALLQALSAAGLDAEQVAAVAAGVAGASGAHSASWLQEVINEVVPGAAVVASSDYEIALVGAHGRRLGVLVLAGTGSVAYGVNSDGESALVDGWGYLLGDEGSGYWLGEEALRAVARASDGRGPDTSLRPAVLEALGLPEPRALIGWLYGSGAIRTSEIAGLAPMLLEQAEAGDAVAQRIAEQGADELALKVRVVMHQLGGESLPIAFAGGLLSGPNPLSHALCQRLGLASIPQPQHHPVIGAALLALSALEGVESEC